MGGGKRGERGEKRGKKGGERRKGNTELRSVLSGATPCLQKSEDNVQEVASLSSMCAQVGYQAGRRQEPSPAEPSCQPGFNIFNSFLNSSE